MSFQTNTIKAIGYVFGAVLCVSLMSDLIQYINRRPRKISTEEVDSYIKNSDYKILIDVPEVDAPFSNYDKRLITKI